MTKIPKIVYLILIIAGVAIGLVIFLQTKLPAQQERQVITQTTTTLPTTTIGSQIDTSDWKTYGNEEYGYEIKYPSEGEISVRNYYGENYVYIRLPFAPGTLLANKELIIIAKKATPETCSNPLDAPDIYGTETIYINSIKFKKELGTNCGMGKCEESISYSTMREDRCISLSLVLTVLGQLSVERLPEFDQEKETKVFEHILSTFRFTK